MRWRHIFTLCIYCACLVVSEERQRSLFSRTDLQKTSCNIQQFCFQMAIVNLSYYLPFKMASSRYQTLCHVRLPVSDISIDTQPCEPSS
jgi:hypothetical protein